MSEKPGSVHIVIFGATGNLYKDKLAKALFLIFQSGDVLPNDFAITAFARKDIHTEEFRSMTKEFILKKGIVDMIKLEEFLTHVNYFQGDFSTKDDFIKLKEYLNKKQNDLTVFHLATASFLYENIFEYMKDTGLQDLPGEVRLMIEKPFGKNESDAQKLENLLHSFFNENNIFNIDHYLAKETVQRVYDFRFKNIEKNKAWDIEEISKVKIIFNESNFVGSRGVSYDNVGAFRDVGENHMLEILALALMDRPDINDASSIRSYRAKALSELYVDYDNKITKGQYESYLRSPGVDPDSKTETFFRIFLRSKNPKLKDAIFEMESGKGLIDLGSDITSTTVVITIYLKNGEGKEFIIQPLPGTVYESYTKVYKDALNGDQTLFVSIDEILFQWKIADDLLEKWKDHPLVIYKDGSNPRDIH